MYNTCVPPHVLHPLHSSFPHLAITSSITVILPLVALEELDTQDDNDKVADQVNTSNANISPAMRDIHIQVPVEILAIGVLAVLAPGGRVGVVEVPCGALEEVAGVLDAALARGGFKNIELCLVAADFKAVELRSDEALDDVVVPVCDLFVDG